MTYYPNNPNGQATGANSSPVVLASDQTLALPAGASTSALQSTGNTSLSSIDTKTPALGQALAAASVPVILPTATITTLTPPAAITGFALEAGHLATIDTSTARIPAQGQALAAASLPVVLPAAQITTLTPPAAITGFALEAGHLATIDTSTARIPAQGQALAAASLPVVLTAAQVTTLTPLSTIAATQSGTWTIQPGNTANTTPWLVGHGKTIKSVTGSGTATATVIAAVASKRLKITSISLITTGTAAVTVTFKDGAAGTAVYTMPLLGSATNYFGLSQSTAAPAFLFATTAGNLLELSFSAAVSVTYNISYFDDDTV